VVKKHGRSSGWVLSKQEILLLRGQVGSVRHWQQIVQTTALIFSGDFCAQKFILQARQGVTLREKLRLCRLLFWLLPLLAAYFPAVADNYGNGKAVPCKNTGLTT